MFVFPRRTKWYVKHDDWMKLSFFHFSPGTKSSRHKKRQKTHICTHRNFEKNWEVFPVTPKCPPKQSFAFLQFCPPSRFVAAIINQSQCIKNAIDRIMEISPENLVPGIWTGQFITWESHNHWPQIYIILSSKSDPRSFDQRICIYALTR